MPRPTKKPVVQTKEEEEKKKQQEPRENETYWEKYKREHNIQVQSSTATTKQQEPQESYWERYKRETGVTTGNPAANMTMFQNEQRRAARKREADLLQEQKTALENAAPTATGNLDAEWAGYYRKMADYARETGDSKLYYDSYLKYRDARDRVAGQYASHEARHKDNATDKKMDVFLSKQKNAQGAENRLKDADRRYTRDASFYNRMARDANAAKDYELYQKAAKGYSEAQARREQADRDYEDFQAADLERKKTEAPAEYYAATMSADEVDQKLEELNAIRADVHRNAVSYGDAFNVAVNEHDVEKIERLKKINARVNERLNDLDTEIAYYEAAQKYQKQQTGDQTYDYWIKQGGLEQPENWAKVEPGKAKYEADRLAASGGMKEPEIATPAGGAIKAYRKRKQKENEWDNIFDTAPNLTPTDKNVFYALYADDPEKAIEWAYYINNRRNSEFQGEMAEFGHEHPGWAWLGGLGSRMISGVANIVDENSAFAQKQSLQSTGLMSGGAQAVNEWSGTIDTDIPIIRDLFNGKGAGDFYQLASSIVESGINMAVASYTGDAAKLVGTLGTIIMGSSAAVADYNESLQRGLTTAQAQRHALAAGINEAAFEFISLDKVIKADKLAGQLKKVFVDAGIEASEEFCTTVANRIADGYLARQDGYDTQVEQRTKELIALGLSRAEAEAQAEREWRVELINDAIGGFISGGFHAGIEWGGGKVANKIATNQYNEMAGIMTDADEIAALRAYADENGIAYNEKALQAFETAKEEGTSDARPYDAQATEDGGQQTTAPASAENASEETTEKKQSRRETRQERKSNRATGALQTQVEANLAKTLHESGLNNVQAFFDQTVSRYGEGITRTAQNAVANEARSVFGQASSQAELTDLYQKALEGVTAQQVRQALQKVYNEGTAYLYKRGDEGAKNRLIQQIGNTGKQFNTTVVLQNEDGTERSAKITDVLPGAERVKLDSGETVAVSDLAGIDADTKDILDMIGRLEIGSAADILWKSFKVEAGSRTNSENSRYILDWTQAFDQGRTNTITMEEAVRRSSLDKATVEQAYKLGQQERATMDEAKKERLAMAREQAKKGFTGKKGILDDTGVSKHALERAMQNDSTLKEQIKMAEVIAEALGVDIKLFNSFDKKTWHGTENGSYNAATNTIMLDINAGKTAANDFTSGLLAVCGHELTHWMETFAFEAYGKYKDAVVKYIVEAYGKDGLNKLIHEQQERNQNLSRDEAIDEIVADASMDRMGDKSFWQAVAENLVEDRAEVREKIAQFFDKYLGKIKEALGTKQVFMSRVNVARLEKQMQDALSALYAEGIREAAKNRKVLTGTATETKNAATEGGNVQFSTKEIVDKNGKSYGMGVYMDSNLFNGLTEDERVEMFREYLDEISGQSFDAVDKNNNKVKVNIADKGRRFTDHNGKHVRVNDDLRQKYKKNHTKQEAVALIDEVLQNAAYKDENPAKHPHDWLDNNGANPWQGWKSYMQSPDGTVYEAILHITTADNGELFLYDITPKEIKEAGQSGNSDTGPNLSKGQSGNSDTSPLKNKIAQEPPSVKPGDKKSSRPSDTAYLDAVERGDMETAQKMVDEAAKRAGYTIEAYHGTDSKHTVFDPDRIGSNFHSSFGGFYFRSTNNVEYYGKNTMHVFLKMENPMVLQAPDGFYNAEDYYDVSPLDRYYFAKSNKNDGIIVKHKKGNMYLVFDSEQIKSADPVTYDDSGKVIPLSERFNPEKDDIRFSMRSPVEQTDRLIAWHNMSEEALRSALELGGLAMPSWAIKTADKAHTSYGEISVIAPRSLVDPKLNRNSMIFGGDAWTPVFPDVNYKISSDAVDALTDEIEGLIGKDALRDLGGAALDETNIADQFSKHGGAVSNYYKRNQALRYAYLKSIGQDIELPKTAKRLDDSGKYENDAVENFASRLVYGKKSLDHYRKISSKELMQDQDLKKAITDTMVAMYGEEVRDAYAPEELSFRDIDAMLYAASKYFSEGIREQLDSRAVGQEIDKVIDEAAYEKWIGDKLNATIERKGIRNNKDPFTPSGKRRSFDELNYAYNLANIVKAMKAQPKQGRTQFLSGPGSVKGAALKNYRTVEQVRADRGRLVNTAEEGKAAYDAYNDNLADILDRMSKTGDRFDTADALIEILQHAKTEDAIYRYMERELKDWYNVSRDLAHDIYKLIGQINELPMEYFEGKTYDAVSFDETAAVVVPDTISADLKQQLIDAGANVIEYKAGDNEDRLAKVNSAENVQFSTRDTSLPSDLDLALSAADEIVDGGGDAYWASLLESDPGIAGEAEEIKRLGKQLKKTEADLAEARRNLTLTDRKLKTRGIASLAATIMQDQKAGDVNHNDVQKRITAVLTEAYQKALDQLDAGADVSDAWETVYQEGVVKAADILLTDATYAEKHGYGWLKTSLGQYLGEGGREYVEADIAARVAQDFDANRYRPGQKGTVADRLVAQAENRVNKKLDAAKTENAALKAENAKLTEIKDFYKEQAETAKATAGELHQQLLDKREELKNNKKIGADERKATLKKLDNMTRQMQAKRREAEVWKSKSEIGWKAANQAIREKEAAVSKLEKQLQREKDILEGKLKPPAIQKMLKAAREREAERVAQQKDERFAKYKERKNETALRGRIKNLHDEMNRDLLKPREGHFVPQGLIRPVVDLLDMVNTQTKRAKSESAQAKINAINAAYDRIKNDERYSQYYDKTVKIMLTELSATLEGRSIYELSYSELEDVYTVMKAMRTTIRNSIKADMIERGKEVWEVGNALRQELRAGKGANPLLLEKYHMAMLSAERAFHRFGGYMPDSTWDKTYRMLDNAQLKMLMLEMQATRLFDSVLLGKADFAKAEALTSYDKKDLVDVGLKDANGNAVPITRGMMLSLYMHLQNEENMRHLMYGGLTLPDFRRYYKGQENAWGKGSVSIPALGARISNLNELLDTVGEAGVTEQYEAEQQAMREMWESVRGAIEDQLSEYDRKWIAASKDFFDNFSRRELNRVTNEMYGFSKAKVDNYFPIVTDKNFLKTDFDSISRDISLENMGFMKERVKAGNPILLEDITKAVNRQISNVARYAGLTQALKTFNNVYNVQTKGYTDSVKKAMSETFEDTGKKYIENLITDMVGGRTQPGTIFDRIKGNYAQAVLSANLSVTIKQAASFWTAAATVGWKPLMKALAKGGQKGRIISRADKALIGTYTPLLWKRSQGAIDTEIGDMAHAQDWTKKAKWLMGWIEKTDIATVGRLWYAAEYYVKENFDLSKGTEDQIKNGESPFYRKVAEVFNQIVEDTQPNYTILQRPDILRNPNKLVRAMTMFSTQRFQNANILIDAAGEYNAMRLYNKQSNTAESKASLKAAKQKLTRAISSQVVSAAVLNVMTLVAAALMHRMKPWRDDDDEITAESIREELMNGFLSTMAGSFLAGSELYEAVSSMLTGSKYYGNDVGGISTINEFATAVVQFGQQAVKLIGDENSKPSDWAKLAEKQLAKVGQYLAQMTGIPAANINKIIAGGKNHIIDAVNGEFFSFEAGVERSAAVNARRLIKALEAGDEAKAEAVMEEMRQNILKEKPNLKADKVNAKIQSAVQSYVKQQYLDDEMSEEKAIHYMVEYGSADDENDAFWKIREWEAREAWDGEADDFTFSKYTKLREIIDNVGDISEEMQYLQDHGVKFEDANKEIKSYIGKQLKAGAYDEDKAMKTLQAYHKVKDEKTKQYRPDTEDEAWFTVQEWAANAEHADDEDYSWSKYEDLFAAMDKGGDIEPHRDELEIHGVKESDIKEAIGKHVRELYEEGTVDAGKAMKLLQKYKGMDANEAYWEVDKWDAKEAAYNAGEEFTDSNYRDLYAAMDANKDASAAIKKLTNHGYKERDVREAAQKYLVKCFEDGKITEDRLKNHLSRYAKVVKQEDVSEIVAKAKCYKETGYRLDSLNNSYLDGEITAEKFKQIRGKYGGKTAEEAKKQIRWLDLKKKYPNLDIDDDTANRYYDGTKHTTAVNAKTAEKAGLSIEAYLKARAVLKDVKGYDNNGDGKADNYSREKMFIQALDGMNLTAAQKWALYYEEYEGKNWKKVARPSW